MIAPQVAGDAHGLMNAAGVMRLQMLHQLGDAPFTQRFEDEVDVVGHEAEGMDADAVAAGQAIEAVEVADELGTGLEDSLAAAAALVDVIDLPDGPVALLRRGGEESGFGLHAATDKWVSDAKILTYFRKIFARFAPIAVS